MKPIYTTLFTLLMATSLMAGTITSKDGDWTTKGTWNLTPSRAPQSGDSIIIPSGKTVSLADNVDLDNVIIVVAGELDLKNGKLRLDDASRIIVQTGGKITGVDNNDQIKIGTEFKFKGTQLVQLGFTFADASTGSGFAAAAPLPVIFQAFYVTRQGSNIQLSWSTSQEESNNYYAIERSNDGRSWKQVAVVMGAGTSSLVSKYGYTDKNINDAVVYYRIRQVDMNGSAFYSAIRFLKNTQTQLTNIYASSNKTITIDFNSDVKDNVSIQLINMNGQVVVRQEFNQASYRLIVNAMSASSGVYAVRVSDSKGWSEVKKIAL